MKSLKESAFGITCLLIVVACGYGYLNCAGLENGSLAFLSGESRGKQLPQISVSQIDWTADSRVLLSLSRGEPGPEGPLLLHNRSGSRRSIDIDPEEVLASTVLAPDGLHVLVGTYAGRLLWIDAESTQSRILFDLPEPAAIKPVALSPDGRTAAAAAHDGRIFVCNNNLETPTRVLLGPPSTVRDLNFSSAGDRLVSASMNGWVGVWDPAEGALEWEFAAHDGPVTTAAFLSGGEKLITAGSDDTVRIWNVAEQHEEWTGQFEYGATSALALSIDGKTAAWAGLCHKIFVWDLECKRKKFEIATPSFSVRQLKFSPDGKVLAAAVIEGTIRLYDAETGNEMEGIDLSTRR